MTELPTLAPAGPDGPGRPDKPGEPFEPRSPDCPGAPAGPAGPCNKELIVLRFHKEIYKIRKTRKLFPDFKIKTHSISNAD